MLIHRETLAVSPSVRAVHGSQLDAPRGVARKRRLPDPAILKSGGHGIRTRNRLPGTSFPMRLLAIRLPSSVASTVRRFITRRLPARRPQRLGSKISHRTPCFASCKDRPGHPVPPAPLVGRRVDTFRRAGSKSETVRGGLADLPVDGVH